MRGFGFIVVAFGLLAGTAGLSQEKTEDKQKILGAWKVVSFEASLDRFDAKVARVVITADKLTFEFAERKLEARYKLDPSKKPKAIDVEGNAVDPKTKDRQFVPGIYLLEGDELKLCWDANGKSRPTDFTKVSKGGQDRRLLVLKREKKG